jgi:uncharacterized protein (TIGR03437 family)
MQSRRIFAAKCATILSVPVLLFAYASGPEPRKTGAPGDTTCMQSQCHVGTAVNASGVKVELTFSGGTTYVPGERQRITIRNTEPGRVYGFQLTARLASNETNGQAGRFVAVQPETFVLCNDGEERDRAPRNGTCRAGQEVEFIEHSAPSSTGEFTVEWIPPASNVGDIRFYVASNAANGNGKEDGDKIFTANATLIPRAASGGPAPTISQGGVSDAFNGQAGLASSTWISIYGENLAAVTRDWNSAPDFNEGRLPTLIEGVRVTVNGKAAPIHFVSPGQINVLAPTDDSTGDVQVVVTNAAGDSTPVVARKAAVLPAIYAPFRQNDRLFATVVENATGAILGKPGVEPRATRAVRPGDIIQIYASGLGPTTPPMDAGRTIPAPAATASTPIVRFGDSAAEVFGAALTAPGLYQVNARVPASVADGDQPFTLEISGTRSPNNVYITIQR